MIVKIVQDTGVVEAASIVLETAKFSVVVVVKEAKERANLQLKLETILKAYNEAKEGIANRDNIITRLQSQLAGQHHLDESSTLMIASSPARPPSTSPIIEYPPSPMLFGFQSTETVQHELENLKQVQALFANKYEEKVKATILKFADSVRATTVYINMKRIEDVLFKFREDEATLEPILNKWMPRGKELELMCSSHVDAEENDNTRSTSEFIKEMNILSEEREGVKGKAQLYRKEYSDHKFDCFQGDLLVQFS